MSQERLLELATRRGELTAQIAMQRAAVAGHVWPIENALGAADRVVDGAHWLKRHPRALIAIAVAVAIAKPKRAWRLARRAMVLWQGWKTVRHAVAG